MFDTIGVAEDPGRELRFGAGVALLLAATCTSFVALQLRPVPPALPAPDVWVPVEITDDDDDAWKDIGGAPTPPAPKRGTPAEDARTSDEAPDDPAPLEPDPEPQPVTTDNVGTGEAATSTPSDQDGPGDGPGRGTGTGTGTGTGPGHDGVRFVATDQVTLVRSPPPPYPAADRGLYGDVRCVLTVRIDDRGHPDRIEVQGCPYVFGTAAEQAVWRWRWRPARVQGEPIPAWFRIGVTFRSP